MDFSTCCWASLCPTRLKRASLVSPDEWGQLLHVVTPTFGLGDLDSMIRVLGQLERRMLDDMDDTDFDLPTVTGSATAALGDEDVGWLYDEFTSAWCRPRQYA